MPSQEGRVVISLIGGILQCHRLPVTRLKQDDQHQQTVERQRNESAAFVTRKVGFSLILLKKCCLCSRNSAWLITKELFGNLRSGNLARIGNTLKCLNFIYLRIKSIESMMSYQTEPFFIFICIFYLFAWVFFFICRSHQEDLPNEQITYSRCRYSVDNNIGVLTHNVNRIFSSHVSDIWEFLSEFLEHFSCGSNLNSAFYIILLLQRTSCNFVQTPRTLSKYILYSILINTYMMSYWTMTKIDM